jgi:hypothetical protein
VIVTSDDATLPDGCHPGQVAGLVMSFVDAFNSGDQTALSRSFFLSEGPSPPDFSDGTYDPWSWYTVSNVEPGGKIVSGFVTYDQGELLRYFAQRHKRGERLRLLKVSLMKAGDDRSSYEAANWLCTDPPGWRPGKAVVACA